MVPNKQLPTDASGTKLQEFPTPFPALVTRNRDSAIASSVITLNENTTVLEVISSGGPAFLKWIPTTDTAASVISGGATANFDNGIAKDTVRRFTIPIERFVAQYSVVGLNKQYGLYQRVAIIGVASVASTEY